MLFQGTFKFSSLSYCFSWVISFHLLLFNYLTGPKFMCYDFLLCIFKGISVHADVYFSTFLCVSCDFFPWPIILFVCFFFVCFVLLKFIWYYFTLFPFKNCYVYTCFLMRKGTKRCGFGRVKRWKVLWKIGKREPSLEDIVSEKVYFLLLKIYLFFSNITFLLIV